MGIKVVIVGGGVSGLSLAYELKRAGEFEIMVLEREARVGGKIWTERADEGYVCEGGVNGFLDNKPGTRELAASLGLASLRSSDEARKRFVYSDGKLQRLPETPPAFLKSGLMSWGGKLRLAMEPFIRRAPADVDESLADFGRRRLGREAFEKLIDPMASGIYAGDPEQMSLRSCFARIHELEQTYGSLVKGMVSLMRERKRQVSAAPAGVLTSFGGGMGDLIGALTTSLGEGVVHRKSPVRSIEPMAEGYYVHLADGTRVEAEVVALACPAYAASEIVADIDREASAAFASIRYPSLSVVCTGYRAGEVDAPVDAFGFLVPFREGRRILGTLYDSSVFTGRAPEGRVLLRTMVGGARASDVADLDDRKLVSTVLGEIRSITGLTAEPEFTRVFRHPQAIPQYNVGHSRVVEAADRLTDKHPGLYVAGNAFRGVSVNDCAHYAARLAERISKEVA
jgi:oxygen-dependent protoporphyrinogen oxidase